MKDPHTCDGNPAHGNLLHHQKTEQHHRGGHRHQAEFRFHRHGARLHKVFQMLFVKLRGQKPAVQPLAAFGKAESGQQEKGVVGKMGSTTPTAPSAMLMTPRVRYRIFRMK